MQTLRTTINPTEEITVDDREATDLEAYGVVLTGTRAKTDEGLTAAAVRQVTEPAPDEVDETSPEPTDVDSDAGDTADGDPADGDTDGGDAEKKKKG